MTNLKIDAPRKSASAVAVAVVFVFVVVFAVVFAIVFAIVFAVVFAIVFVVVFAVVFAVVVVVVFVVVFVVVVIVIYVERASLGRSQPFCFMLLPQFGFCYFSGRFQGHRRPCAGGAMTGIQQRVPARDRPPPTLRRWGHDWDPVSALDQFFSDAMKKR